MHTWELPSVARIIDKVKSHLLTEMSGAEWELLEEKEWNEERADEEAVIVGGTRRSLENKTSPMSAEPGSNPRGEAVSDGKGKGASGWMKLKSRGAEGG